MAPKGTSTKKEGGRAKKVENEAKKQQDAAADKERKEAEIWDQGAKPTKSEDKEKKRREELARKAENARLLAEEETSLHTQTRPAPKAGGKKAAKAVDPAARSPSGKATTENQDVESFAATGIDDALDLLEVVTAKMDKASVGQQAAGIEKHPERRFKAAFEAYKEKELPRLKEDHPGLRLHQYHEMLRKQFQKSDDNPFNQVTVAYDASKEEKANALHQQREVVKERLRT